MKIDKEEIMFYIYIALATILVVILCAPEEKGVGIETNKCMDIAVEVADELN